MRKLFLVASPLCAALNFYMFTLTLDTYHLYIGAFNAGVALMWLFFP